MTEKRYLLIGDFVGLCERENLYTLGHDEDFHKLVRYILKRCNEDNNGSDTLTTEDIVYIAENVRDHSEPKHNLNTWCSLINDICKVTFWETPI